MKCGFLAVAAGVFAGAFATAVFAGDEAAGGKPAASSWDAFAKRFDLDKDGKVSWVEYQQVVSGFAGVDANHDGAIDKDEFDKHPQGGFLGLAGFDGVDAPLKFEMPVWGGMPGACGDEDGEGGICLGGSCSGGTCTPFDAGKYGPWMAVGLLGAAADSNHDDVLTRAEWDALVGKLAVDAKGAIDPSSFKAFLPTGTPDGLSVVVVTFFDRDKDGKITAADMAAIFEAADTNKDGSVSRKDAPPISIEVEGAEEK